MPTATGTGTAMAKEQSSKTRVEQQPKVAEEARNPSSKVDDTVKMTLYISKPIAKEFKKRAIDEELDYSQLAEIAFTEYVGSHTPR